MKRRGLTLVELVVTMSIAVVLGTVAIGGMVGVGAWRASSAVRRVQSDLSYARAKAMLTHCRTACVFDSGNGSYQVQAESQPRSGALATSVLAHPLYDTDWEVVLADLGGGVSISSISGISNGMLGFDSNGLPVSSSGSAVSSDVSITFSTGARIVVYANSGMCEIEWP